MQYFDPNRPIRLNNRACVYCETAFGPGRERTKEHVIGRKFVPTGAFDGQWNLIVWACQPCNNIKSTIEEHVAAITMQPDLLGKPAIDDPRLSDEAFRKGKGSISPLTGKPVARSMESMAFSSAIMPGIKASFSFTGPPQLDEQRAWALARYHIAAFFYMITFNHDDRVGSGFPGNTFGTLCIAPRRDWGNVLLRQFQCTIADWPWRVQGIGADEFFKVMIRRAPNELKLWSWALEWNASHRVTGFFGDHALIQKMFDRMPKLPCHAVKGEDGSVLTFREEVPLSDEDDMLFSFDAQTE